MAKQTKKQGTDFEDVQEALSTSELFIEKHQKTIMYGIGVIVLIVLAVLAFRNFYLTPKEAEAENEIAKAQAYFAVDSFRIALVGDDVECIGFESVAANYSFTQTGNLANAYAGICSYKLADYEMAVKYLKKFNGNDQNIAPAVTVLLGDSYVELNEFKKAIDCFNKVGQLKHDIFSPMGLKKAGVVYETLEDYKNARKVYNTIKDNYPKSNEASDIDKYIARIANK